MSHPDVITWPQFVSRIPALLGGIPGLIKGLKVSNPKHPDQPLGLGVCIEEIAARRGEGMALIYGDTQLTYAQFNTWANRIAHDLIARGVRKGDCVVLFMENRPELLACVTACAKVGAVAALVNTAQRDAVLVHSVNLVKPVLAIVGEELVPAWNEVRDQLKLRTNACCYLADHATHKDPGTAPEGWEHLAQSIQSQPTDNPATSQSVFKEDPCFYIYTSGTTGMPKAVIFNHGRFMKAYGAFGFGAVRLTPEDRMYVTLPFYHATAMAVCWGSVLAGQATLIMARKFSARGFWPDVRKHRATAFGYVGELCRYLMDQPPSAEDRNNAVRVMLGNGLRPSLWKDFKNRFGIERVMEFYASSEGNIGFTNVLNFDNTVGLTPFPYAIVQYDKEKEAPVRDANGRLIRVGKGEAGLLIGQITEKTPFHGYTDPAKTESCILRDVFVPGDAWFDSGDLMRDLGFKHAQFVDRLGDTFRWKGENVSTTEVERILDSIPGISETVAYGVEIPGTNGRAGMASIRLTVDENAFDFTDLLAQLRQKLPAFAIPLFLRLSEELETTGTFKHKKAPLKDAGFDLKRQDNPVYAWLPGTQTYTRLTPELQARIEAGEFRY